MCKKICFFLLFFDFSSAYCATKKVEFSFTKPHSLLNFVETLLDKPDGSETVKELYRASRFNNGQSHLEIEKLKSLQLDYSYRYEAYPESRYMVRNTWDLMIIASARCQTLHELKLSTIGLIPNAEHHLLFAGLAYFDSIYSDLIWNDNLPKLAAYCAELSDYAQNRDVDGIFVKLTQFYGSNWDADVPFKVCIYPIPGKRGHSTATPKGNIVTCGVLLDDYDYPTSLSVVFHEVCHLLYREQSPELQRQLETWFLTANNPTKILTYPLADEALATALGNGWVFETISGKLDTTDWYNNFYINRLAKASYAAVKDYIRQGKTIDQSLVNDICIIYEQVFPNALHDCNALLANVHLVADFDKNNTNLLFPTLFKHFRVGGAGLSTPLDEINLNDLSTHLATRVVVVSSDNKNSWEFVKKHLPEAKCLKNNEFDLNFVRLCTTPEGYNYLFINLLNPTLFEKAVEKMKTVVHIYPDAPLFFF